MKQDIISLKKKKIELMSKKHKEAYLVLHYFEHLLTLIFTFSGCISISVFASSVRISVGFSR